MSCDVGKETEGLENEFDVGEVTVRLENKLCSCFNVTVSSSTSQLILQPFRRFTYVTVHSPTLPLLHLRHSSFSKPSFASPTLQALHLNHLANRPCLYTTHLHSIHSRLSSGMQYAGIAAKIYIIYPACVGMSPKASVWSSIQNFFNICAKFHQDRSVGQHRVLQLLQ